jgi:hypothetical protein
MWKIVKADVKYYKVLFLILYLFILPFLFVQTVFRDFENHLIWVSFYTLPIIGIFVSNEEKNTKRNRFLAYLPVSIRYIGMARYPILIAYWVSLVILIYMSSLIGNRQMILISELLSITASGPFIAACMTINLDLRFLNIGLTKQIIFRSSLILGVVMVTIIYLGGYLLEMTELAPFGIFKNPSFAVILSLVTIALLIINLIIYEHRTTYLE